ncbi:hypothetical protein KA005_14305, partial [bacterium]|nr:hypothetical protein [bacterium]
RFSITTSFLKAWKPFKFSDNFDFTTIPSLREFKTKSIFLLFVQILIQSDNHAYNRLPQLKV